MGTWEKENGYGVALGQVGRLGRREESDGRAPPEQARHEMRHPFLSACHHMLAELRRSPGVNTAMTLARQEPPGDGSPSGMHSTTSAAAGQSRRSTVAAANNRASNSLLGCSWDLHGDEHHPPCVRDDARRHCVVTGTLDGLRSPEC